MPIRHHLDWGYLDARTTSIYNTELTGLGMENSGLAPTR
jgi:hypothetical protein